VPQLFEEKDLHTLQAIVAQKSDDPIRLALSINLMADILVRAGIRHAAAPPEKSFYDDNKLEIG
jgi:hypothetical protein